MPSVHIPPLTRSDHEREARITRISRAMERYRSAGMKVEAMKCWERLQQEISQRSPNQVLAMEIEKGLR